MGLERKLEPEVMDSFEEARDYDEMDHSEVNRKFVEDLIGTGVLQSYAPPEEDPDDESVYVDWPEPAGILDLGTGTAQIPILLCEQFENCRIMAVDLAVSMLDAARYNIEIAGLIDRIFLQQIDAKQLPNEDGYFDIVMSNSIVHHIPDPGVVLPEAVRVVKSGGCLFVRDLLRPEDLGSAKQLLDTYTGEAREHQRQMFEDSLRAALSLDEIRELVVQLGFQEDSVQATSDRHWTWVAQKE